VAFYPIFPNLVATRLLTVVGPLLGMVWLPERGLRLWEDGLLWALGAFSKRVPRFPGHWGAHFWPPGGARWGSPAFWGPPGLVPQRFKAPTRGIRGVSPSLCCVGATLGRNRAFFPHSEGLTELLNKCDPE